MAKGRRGPAALAGGLVVLVAAFAGAYLIFFRGDSRAPVALSSNGSKASVGDPVGTWRVVKGPNTWAGYRVREKLAALPAQSDAVGQTPDVTGSMAVKRTADGYSISGIEVEADLTTVKSDKEKRDNKMRTMGLETDRFPKASFTASGPVSIPAGAIKDGTTSLDLAGELTIHGTTRQVTIPVKAQVVGEEIEVVGSLEFPMSDFGITPPSIQPFVSVEPDGTLEFKVRLAKSA